MWEGRTLINHYFDSKKEVDKRTLKINQTLVGLCNNNGRTLPRIPIKIFYATKLVNLK